MGGIKTKPYGIEIHVITQMDDKDNERSEHGTSNYHYKTNTAGINIKKREQRSKLNKNQDTCDALANTNKTIIHK